MSDPNPLHGTPPLRERDELWAALRRAGLQPPSGDMANEVLASWRTLKAAIGHVHAAGTSRSGAKEQP